MSYDGRQAVSSLLPEHVEGRFDTEPVISVSGLGKCYQIYRSPFDRLRQMFFRNRRYFREFWALRGVDFDVMPGEVVGIIGSNGSGKSTMLQLVCETLYPTEGYVTVRGRVAALLELGAGFNPEFSGRENIFLSATITGLHRDEIAARFEDIVKFSGIRDFIDQPVKTYSSGMYVRLAFSIAINVDPDILVIDEALSVGDGEFARRSFARIMDLKSAGKTILFCSHSMYQVESICNRVVWLKEGMAQMIGEPASVIVAYNEFLECRGSDLAREEKRLGAQSCTTSGMASIRRIVVGVNGVEGRELQVRSGEDNVSVAVEFNSDPALPAPSVAVMFTDPAVKPVASAGTRNDGIILSRSPDGRGRAEVVFERIPLLKGNYWVYVFLMCENAVHFYEYANMIAVLHVSQQGLEMGVVSLPHRWE